jgi:hypothetical protein
VLGQRTRQGGKRCDTCKRCVSINERGGTLKSAKLRTDVTETRTKLRASPMTHQRSEGGMVCVRRTAIHSCELRLIV